MTAQQNQTDKIMIECMGITLHHPLSTEDVSALDEFELKKYKQRRDDIRVYVAMGLILLIIALLILVKISFENFFIAPDEKH